MRVGAVPGTFGYARCDHEFLVLVARFSWLLTARIGGVSFVSFEDVKVHGSVDRTELHCFEGVARVHAGITFDCLDTLCDDLLICVFSSHDTS